MFSKKMASNKTRRAKKYSAFVMGLAVAGAGLWGGVSAQAAVIYWDGGDTGNSNWTDGNNWSSSSTSGTNSDTVSVGTGNDVVFYRVGAADITNSVLESDVTVASLTVGNGQTGAVTINVSTNDELSINGKANFTASSVNSGSNTNLGTVGIFIQSGSGAVTVGAPVILGTNDQKWINNSANLLTINGSINANDKSLTIDGTGTVYLNGRITNADTDTITKSNAGDLILGNSGTGSEIGTIAVNAGRLFVFNANAISTQTDFNVANGATLVYGINGFTPNANNDMTFVSGAGLAHRGTGTLTVAIGSNVVMPTAGSMLFNVDDTPTNAILVSGDHGLTGPLTLQIGGGGGTIGDVTFSGNITGTGGLTKSQIGKLILTGSGNNYSGGTTISGGTLALTGSGALPSSGVITVQTGATLDTSALASTTLSANQTLAGTGTVNVGAAKTLTVSGTFAPGGTSTVGTLAVTGNTTIGSGGNVTIDLGAPGASHAAFGTSDRTTVSGNLALNGTLNLVNNGGAGVGSYKIFSQTGTATGAFTTVNDLPGLRAKVDTATSGSVFLDVYRLAVANRSPSTLNFANYHVGDASTAQAITVSNTATADAWSEKLDAAISATSGISTTGAVSLLAAGASNSTSLTAAINTATAGAKAGTITLNFSSNGSGVSGLPAKSIGTATVTVTGGNVYAYAAPNTIATPFNAGNIHVGGTFGTSNLTIQNTSPSGSFTEALDATFGAVSGDASTNGGSVVNLAGAGTNNSAMQIGLGGASTATAGPRTGTVEILFTSKEVSGSGLGNTTLASQTVTVQGGVFNLASTAYAGETINFANYHVGDAVTAQSISISNTAPGGSHTERLDATFGTPTGGVSVAGSISLLTPEFGNNTSMNVGISTATAGSKAGTVAINFVSNGTGTSGLGNTSLGSQTVTVTGGNVYRYAAPNNITNPVSLGNIRVGGSFGTAALAIQNTAVSDAFSEGLNASFGAGTAGDNGASINNLAGGASNNSLIVDLNSADTSTSGIKSGSISVNFASNGTNSGFSDTSLATQNLTVQGGVYNYAATNFTGQTINFGNVHVGATLAPQSVVIQNTAAGLADNLEATLGSISNPKLGATGTPASIAAGGSSSGLNVTGSASSSGSLAGTINVALISKGSTNGLDDLSLGNHTITVTGNVYTGTGVWNTNGSGNWSDFSKWTAAGGVPGVDGALSAADTATFSSGLSSNPGTISLNGTSPSVNGLTFNNATQSYTIAQGSGGTLTVKGITNTAGSHTISAPLALGAATPVNVANAADVLTISGNTSGGFALNKTGPGLLVLSGTNSYTGTTDITAGTLRSNTLPSGNLRLAGGVLEGSGTFTRGTNTGSNGVDWTGSGGFSAFGGTLTIQLGGGTAAERWDNSDFVPNGQALIFGSATANSLVDFQNVLSLGTQTFLGSGAFTREIRVIDNPIVSTDYAKISNGLTFSTAFGSQTFGINKTGNGLLEIAGSSNYNGTTTVSAGTLVLNGTHTGGGAYTVNSGAKLGGSGSTASAITILAGATLAPGNSIEDMASGNLVLSGNFDVDLGTPGATPAAGVSDRQVVTGTVNLTGSTLNLIDNAGANSQGSASGGAYRILTNTSTRTGTFTTVNNPMSSTLHHKVIYSANAVDVELYNLAAAAPIATPINLGNIRAGTSFGTQTLSITNTAPLTFSEGLNATVGSPTGNATHNSGSFSNVLGTNSSALTVGLNGSATAGAKSGTVTVNFASNGTNSGWSNNALESQFVTVTGNVYDYATPTFAAGSLPLGAAFTANLLPAPAQYNTYETSYSVDFGGWQADTGIKTVTLNLANILIGSDANYQDLLNGSYVISGSGAFAAWANFADILASSSLSNLNLTFDTTALSPDVYSGTLTFTPVSTGVLGYENLPNVVFELSGEIFAGAEIPEPASLGILALGGLALIGRRRK